MAIFIRSAGLECEALDVGVGVTDCSPDELRAVLGSVTAFPSIEQLGEFVGNLRNAKLDDHIDEDLLRRLWCDRNRCNLPSAASALRDLRF
jgi:ATP-dependent Lhr-like helicase